MSLLDAASLDALIASMRFRSARQGALASNVVNADTPGYRRVDLSFDGLVQEATRRMERTDPRHLGASGAQSEGAGASGAPSEGAGAYRTELGPRGTRPDGNGVELQHELIQLSRNASQFNQQATVVAKLLQLRRLAVTGQAR